MASSSATSASASSSSQSSGNAVKEFWEMPKRFWGAGSGRGALDEWEIDSIMSGGASNYTPRR
ncbi:hypothetical protein FRC03_012965 [Tulasnella sp. 419]|nr:hypothetical protein FRC03_012965 [Tulasnella sp. 419]